MKEFSLRMDVPEDLEYDQTSLAIASEWLVSVLRWIVLAVFAFLQPYVAPGAPEAKEPLYLFLLLGVLYNLYVSYNLSSGAVRRNPTHYLSFFIFSDILILVALAYFSNLYQEGLLVFYLLLIIIIALRASLRLSLLLGPVMIVAYFVSTAYLLDPSHYQAGRMVMDSIGLMALTAFCGWFAEGKSRAWKALYNLSQRFQAVHKSLDETQRRLEIYRRLEEMRREFIAMVSHELRTPLTAILGYLDLLLLDKGGPLEETQRDFINSAVNESENLERLISNLIDLSLIQSGRWKLKLDTVHPEDLLEQARDRFRSHADQKKITLAIVPGGSELSGIIADEAKVLKAFENLVGNAIRFSPAGSSVELSAVEEDDARLREYLPHLISSTRVVTLSVRDNGPGISPEEQAYIFESFHRIAGNPERDLPRGGGLGLAIAKEFVELHWGRIWYEDTPGGGSTFRFSLPVSPLRPRQRIALVLSDFNIESVLSGLLRQFQKEIERKRLGISRKGWITGVGKGTSVTADRQLVQALFFNIINNQVRYASEGTELHFAIEKKKRSGEVTVLCRNRGASMNWELLEKLRSGEPEAEDQSLRDLRQINISLGLARDIMETHGGSFSVENVENEGVETRIRFPGRRESEERSGA